MCSVCSPEWGCEFSTCLTTEAVFLCLLEAENNELARDLLETQSLFELIRYKGLCGPQRSQIVRLKNTMRFLVCTMKRKYMSYTLYHLFWCIICCGHGGVMLGSRTESFKELTGICEQSIACLDVC
jgi:hypothetical protein